MAAKIRRVEYFFVTVPDQPGEACRILSELAHHQVNLVGFAAMPIGPASTQLTIFPEETGQFIEAARLAGLHLAGPHHAFLVQGDDELGALAEIHEQLYEANVNVWASQGVAHGHGTFGYIIYVRPEHYELAASALSAAW